MIIKINVGGVVVSFGEPNSVIKPEPFYPYLLEVQPVQDSTGEQTGAATLSLSLKAKGLVGLNLRRVITIWDDKIVEKRFEGILSRIAYGEVINLTVDA